MQMPGRPRNPKALLAVVLCAALGPFSGPALAFDRLDQAASLLKLQPPTQFSPHGLAQSLPVGGEGSVRVRLLLRTPNLLAAAALARRAQLTLDPTPREQRALRRAKRRYATAFARRQIRRREGALSGLHAAALRTSQGQRPVADTVRRAGGRLIGADPTLNSLDAIVPRRALRALAARRDVQAIEALERMRPLSLSSVATNIGADSWWGSGHSGGHGTDDTNPANLEVVGDPIYWAHPALAGISVEHPQGAPIETPNGSVHGTGGVSVAVSQGATGCALCVAADASDKGIAPGVNKVLDSNGAGNGLAWGTGVPFTYYDNGLGTYATLQPAQSPAQVFSYSYGGSYSVDDSADAQSWDGYVDSYGATAAISAGNDGPTSSTINDPSIGYNVISAGGFCCANGPSRTGDSVFSWSSRGPTVTGREKPDLVAAGDADVADSNFAADGKLWQYMTGTSFAAPQVAGAALLFAGAGITDPKSVKAVLINSALPGRSAPAAAMGTQSGWQPDWGWGELSLTDALAQRLNFGTGSVPPNGARFFASSVTAAGERATLVWHRRVNLCYVQGCGYDPRSTWHAFTLSHLALTELDATSGTVQATSATPLDNVQQVRSTGAGSVVYKVTAGGVDGVAAEPFSLAAKNAVTPLAAPQLRTSIALSTTGWVRSGAPVIVTANVTNPSPDLTAEDTRLTLNLPAGVSIVAGTSSISLGTLEKRGSGSETAIATWTVQGTTDGLKQLTATTTASRFGANFSSSAVGTFSVAASPPVVTLAVPTGVATSLALPVSWGATAGPGIGSYDVQVSVDGASFSSWLSGTVETSATYRAAVGHSYRFAVRATDMLGNVSDWRVSSPLTTLEPDAGLPLPGLPKPPGIDGGSPSVSPPSHVSSPGLHIGTVRRIHSGLLVTGELRRSAKSRILVTWQARGGRRIFRVQRTVSARRGRFAIVLPVPTGARSLNSALILNYPGDPALSAQTRRIALRLR
ncbi:MAG: hypothetical protein NVSMB25_14820 [Thermoleophilaceae bacterium]